MTPQEQEDAKVGLRAEIERWKVQHEEMLLKHAREQHTALSTLDEAMKEIERLKGQVDVRDSVIAKLSGTVAEWRPLLTRAADALESQLPLIQELRKAAK